VASIILVAPLLGAYLQSVGAQKPSVAGVDHHPREFECCFIYPSTWSIFIAGVFSRKSWTAYGVSVESAVRYRARYSAPHHF
jgi:hypothetical protein